MPHVEQLLEGGPAANELQAHAHHAAGATGFGAAEACLPATDAVPIRNVQPQSKGETVMEMPVVENASETDRYARCVANSKRIRWDIDRDVIRGRRFDFSKRFLPDGLSRVDRLAFLSQDEKRLLSQVQGRTYANMFGLVERFIAAKVLEVSRAHWLGNQNALEALVRFGDEEIKHQELFRRIERLCAEGMPTGYVFVPDPNAVATAVLSKSTWAVLALTCHIELFVLAHYRESIESQVDLSELWKDVFLFHWREEAQHAIIDEMEWRSEHARLSADDVDRGVTDLIDLVVAVDGLLQAQAGADADYFTAVCGRTLAADDTQALHKAVLDAYRWQYIMSGVSEPRFTGILGSMIDERQSARIGAALAPLGQA
jgi:hypothetical protein